MKSRDHLEYSWYDRGTQTYELSVDNGGDHSASTKIVLAVAEIADVDPIQMAPLYETIDPDVLNRLPEHDTHGSKQAELTFSLEGHEVTLHANGRVQIVPPNTN